MVMQEVCCGNVESVLWYSIYLQLKIYDQISLNTNTNNRDVGLPNFINIQC